MKKLGIIILLSSFIFVQCGVDPINVSVPSEECIKLQEELNRSTDIYQSALEAYTNDTNDPALCEAYKESMEDRIEKSEAMLNAGCLEAPVFEMTMQAIEDHKNEIMGLDC